MGRSTRLIRAGVLARLIVAGLAAVCPSHAGATTGDEEVRGGVLTGIWVDAPDDPESSGALAIGRERIVVPSGVKVELPGDALTLQQVFAQAPARCRERHESGLLRADSCARTPRDPRAPGAPWSAAGDDTPRTSLDPEPTDELPETKVRVTGVRQPGGGIVATTVALTRDDRSVRGAVTFVNEDEGYLRIGGAFGLDTGGALVRINDPLARQSLQTGRACGSEGNCSPDTRFRANAVNATVRFAAGYTACVPYGIGNGCDAALRPLTDSVGLAVMVPILKGDHVTAVGGYVVIDNLRVFSAHALIDETTP